MTTLTAPPVKPDLPAGWRWARLGDVAILNPRRNGAHPAPSEPTSFVPMAAVDERRGAIAERITRPYSEVSRGYTYFEDGDVLFAKITPCMQNGKHAIAKGLTAGFGFGTTEFHVIRPSGAITSEWIHHYLRQPSVLSDAERHFTGAVGQQRVPESFLAALAIPLPPLAEQRRIAAILGEQMAEIDRARAAAEQQLAAARALLAAYLRSVFESDEARAWPCAALGDVLALRKEVIHPYNDPSGPALFVGLEHIASGTGERMGSVEVEMSALTGRKPQFFAGDIVYGYLRPYLNKVWLADFDGLCSVDQYVFAVRREQADSDFVAWFMRSPAYLNRAPSDASPGQLPRIRTEEVLSVVIPLPDIETQQRIARRAAAEMRASKKIHDAVEEQLGSISSLVSSCLRAAFCGELWGLRKHDRT